jgi:peptidoglycan hydrolase-like protein with peptidoglycan-binding domain
VGVLPDLTVRAAQLYLTYLGFHPGPIDGVAGEHTLAALAQFQAQNGVQQTKIIDVDAVARLRDALPSIDDMPNAA